MAQEPGRTTPLTPSEVEEVFANALNKNVWKDSDGKLHRDGDLPAQVWANGTQYWYQHGKMHRDGDLPAAIYSNGTMTWFEHGEKTGDQDNPPPGAIFPGQQTKSARKK